MRSLYILASFLDQPFVAGYSLRSILEYWWVGAIVVGVGALAVGGTYALKAHVFGKNKFTGGEEEILKDYKAAPRAEKKQMRREMSKPLKNVTGWKKMAPWFVPTVMVSSLVVGAGAAFLPTKAFKNLMTTVSGSSVVIIDTPTSRAIAKEAEANVIVIEEEGMVLLKNEEKALPIDLDNNPNINIFGSCAFGLYYGNGGSGSFQTDGRYGDAFSRVATKLEDAMEKQGFEYNKNIHNMIKTTIAVEVEQFLSRNLIMISNVAITNMVIKKSFLLVIQQKTSHLLAFITHRLMIQAVKHYQKTHQSFLTLLYSASQEEAVKTRI